MNFEELNELYSKLESKASALISEFIKIHSPYQVKLSYGSCNYSINEDGTYQLNLYPIPIISVKHICFVDVGIDQIVISTKIKKDKALKFNYELLKKYNYIIYDCYKYPDCCFLDKNSDDLLEQIKEVENDEIGFSFKFKYDLDSKTLVKFISFLVNNKFYI